MAVQVEKVDSLSIVEALREMAKSLDRKANRTELKEAAEVYRKRSGEFTVIADKLSGKQIIIQ